MRELGVLAKSLRTYILERIGIIIVSMPHMRSPPPPCNVRRYREHNPKHSPSKQTYHHTMAGVVLHSTNLACHGVAANHYHRASSAHALETALPDRAGRLHSVAEDVRVARVHAGRGHGVELEEDELAHVPKVHADCDERQEYRPGDRQWTMDKGDAGRTSCLAVPSSCTSYSAYLRASCYDLEKVLVTDDDKGREAPVLLEPIIIGHYQSYRQYVCMQTKDKTYHHAHHGRHRLRYR